MIKTLPGFLATDKRFFWLMLGLGLLLISLIVIAMLTSTHALTGHTVAVWDYGIDSLRNSRG